MTRPHFPALLIVATALTAAAPAAAEPSGPTVQAQAANANFLETAGGPNGAAICLVDSGVDQTPDTATVTDRLAIGGGSDVTDGSPTRHGTRMAAMIAGARNAWGTVGLWPAAKIVSVRVPVDAGDNVTFAGYINGIERCRAIAPTYAIKVISIAIAGPAPPSDEERTLLQDSVNGAHLDGLNVIAAAGNNGAAVQYPGATVGVLSISAVDAGGNLCSFSARPADLAAPGCGLDGLDPATGTGQTAQGTSEATSLTAAAVAALRSRRPELTWEQAEQSLITSAADRGGTRALDVAASFAANGINAAPNPSSTPAPAGTPAPAPVTRPDLSPTPQPRPAAPKGSVTRRGNKLTIVLANRPAGARTRLTLYKRTSTRKLVHRGTRTMTGRKLTLTETGAAVVQLRATYTTAKGKPISNVRSFTVSSRRTKAGR